MSNLLRLEDQEIPALTELAKEQYEECLWAIEKALKKQLEFGRVLLIIKAKLPHGEWGNWVRETFADHKSLRTIQRYMRGADSIATDPSLLDCADSLDGILKIVEDRKPSSEVAACLHAQPKQEDDSPEANARKSPFFDPRLLPDNVVAFGTSQTHMALVEPSAHPGFAYVGVIENDGEEFTFAKRAVRRDIIPLWFEVALPMQTRFKWEIGETEERYECGYWEKVLAK